MKPIVKAASTQPQYFSLMTLISKIVAITARLLLSTKFV